MKVELICVGNELLSGDVVNTNAAYIAQKLKELGHESLRQFTIDDNKSHLSELVLESFGRCDVIIITGGLGPTADDITKEAVCEALGLELLENKTCLNHLETYFKNLGKEPTQNNYKQTTAPKGATIFANDFGTACGIGIMSEGKHVFLLPGPPRELKPMFENYIVPYLKGLSHNANSTKNLNVFGLGESAVENIIKEYCGKENPVVATYWGNNECRVSITATAKNQDDADALCNKTVQDIKKLLGNFVYGVDSQGLAFEVVNALRTSNLKIATAESCTGGMLSQSLTSVPHSSETVEIGILAYSNRIKEEALSVPTKVLNEKGAISKETAMHLAKNVRILSGADIGVGITGNAGPTASENKPVGLVYVAIADRTKYLVKKLTLSPTYDREKIRSYATLTALDLVRKYVQARPRALEGMIEFDTEFLFREEEKPTTVSEPIKATTFLEDNSPVEPEPAWFNPNEYYGTYKPVSKEEMDEEDLLNEPFTKQKKAPLISFAKIKTLLGKILPNKTDNLKDIFIKIIAVIAVVSLLVSSTVLVAHFAEEAHQRSIISTARNDFDFESTERNTATNTYSSFNNLLSQNPDIKAWISISNTNIDNPVYQTTDNEFYLNHNMLKNKSRYGALFFDYRNDLRFGNQSKNITIYGHNMKDRSMFANLLNYKNLNFFKENPVVELKTLYQKESYAIFAIMITAADSKDDNGNLFEYYKSDFSSDEEFDTWLSEAKERSIINTNVSVDSSDNILTLSTCCYDFDDARFVVMAKKVANDYDKSEIDLAGYNTNPKYPQAWYDKNGKEGYKPTNSNGSNAGAVCKHDQPNSYYNVNVSTHSFTCSICNESVTNVPHIYNNEKTSSVFIKNPGDCTHPIVYYKSCECGAKGAETFESTELGPHNFGEWHTILDATVDSTGKKERECDICHKKEYLETPKLDPDDFNSNPTTPDDGE